MPIKGVILILVIAAIAAGIFKDQIYDWLHIEFHDDTNKNDEEEGD